MVDVYNVNVRYERNFGYGILTIVSDITVAPAGQIFVLDRFQMICIVFRLTRMLKRSTSSQF